MATVGRARHFSLLPFIRRHTKFFIFIFIGLLSVLTGVAGVNLWILQQARPYCHASADAIPAVEAAIVLGARVHPGGQVSGMLHARLEEGLALYRLGKVRKLLLSGDHGQVEYDEVNAMRQYMLRNGVKPEDIFLDHAGFDTYDSLYRARDIFQVSSAVIITQRFHLPRAMYIRLALDLNY